MFVVLAFDQSAILYYWNSNSGFKIDIIGLEFKANSAVRDTTINHQFAVRYNDLYDITYNKPDWILVFKFSIKAC